MQVELPSNFTSEWSFSFSCDHNIHKHIPSNHLLSVIGFKAPPPSFGKERSSLLVVFQDIWSSHDGLQQSPSRSFSSFERYFEKGVQRFRIRPKRNPSRVSSKNKQTKPTQQNKTTKPVRSLGESFEQKNHEIYLCFTVTVFKN